MKRMWRNLLFSLRMLRKKPGLTVAVLATLALGIGATTAIYTVVYATLLAPLPYSHPEQLVIVWSKVGGHNNGMSAGDFLDWKEQNRSFSQLIAQSGGSFNIATQDQPEQVDGRMLTPGFFSMLGVPMQLGRDFLPEVGIPGKDAEVVLTNKLWKRLGANRNIVGRQMQINGTPHTVVGVLEPGLSDRLGADLMVPLSFRPDQINHDYHWLITFGRMKPGVTLQQAQADMDAVTARIAQRYPKSNQGWGASVELFKNDFIPRERIHDLWLLLGAVGFVLLIACANIANLLLAKGASRQREIAIRSSMGATRGQVFTQFLTESLVLAMIGGTLGVAFGVALLRAIVAILPEQLLPSEADFQLDSHVMIVSLAATTLAGILFGCAPAWYASRIDPVEALKEGGRSGTGSRSHKLRRVLIMGEFALALSLLAGAGLSIKSVWNLLKVDTGVRTDHVLTFSLVQPHGRFTDPAQIESYAQQIVQSIHSVSGVENASIVTGLPLRGTSDGMPFTIVGGRTYADPSQRPGTGFQSVSPEYMRTFGIQLLSGRTFDDQDTAQSTRVAMVNEEFAKRYLKGMDPFKQRLSIEEILPGIENLGPAVQWQIVGIFHNVRGGDFREDGPEVDVPFAQSLSPSFNVGVRTGVDPGLMSKTIATAVHSVDSQVALGDLRTMDEVKDQVLAGDRFTMYLFSGFAAVALALAAVGIYGLMAFAVSQRYQEIGLRIALGATRGRVMLLVIQEASLLAFAGLCVGFAGAVIVGKSMQASLYGVGSTDFSAIFGVTAVLFLTALAAAYLPARRAASINPMVAMRVE